MKKLFGYFIITFVSSGVLVMIWSGYYLGATTYDFWKNGVEKQAKVISLDHISSGSRRVTSYYYNLEIDDQIMIVSFHFKLKENSSYSVLYLEDREEVILGQSGISLFQIYAAQIGSKFMAVLTIAMFLFMPYGCYKMYSELLSKK